MWLGSSVDHLLNIEKRNTCISNADRQGLLALQENKAICARASASNESNRPQRRRTRAAKYLNAGDCISARACSLIGTSEVRGAHVGHRDKHIAPIASGDRRSWISQRWVVCRFDFELLSVHGPQKSMDQCEAQE
jgi:hypothetical protein